MSRILFAFFCLLALPASGKQSAGVYIQVESYNWKEFIDGRQALEESGPLFGIGLQLQPDPAKFSAKGRAEAYGGEVDYDGETFAGEPLQDSTGYGGVRGDFDLALPVRIAPDKASSFMLFGGLGGNAWQRDLGQDDPDTGYTEDWFTFYARAGAGLYLLKTGDIRGYIEGGVKLPMSTRNHVSVADSVDTQDVDLDPKGQPGAFVEAGLNGKTFFASAFYDYMKFNESDPVTIVVVGERGFPSELTLYQPESEVHVFGANVGIRF